LVSTITGQPVKNFLLLPPVKKVRIRSLKLRKYFHIPRVIDLHQPRCVTVRQRTEQRRIDKRKDRYVGGNAQNQRDKSDGGESRRLEQRTKFVTQVLQDGFEHGQTPDAQSGSTRPLENTGIPGKGSRLEDLDADAHNTFPSKNYGTAGIC